MNISISQSPPIRLSPRQITYYALNNSLPAYDSNYSFAARITNQYGKLGKLVAQIITVAILSMTIFRILEGQLWELTGLPNLEKILLILLLSIFTTEYLGRLWSAPENCTDLPEETDDFREYVADHHYRFYYVISFLGIIDLLVILSILHNLIGVDLNSWPNYVLVLGLFKLSRYIPGIEIVGAVVKKERQILTASLLSLGLLVVILSTALYLAERNAQPDVFKNIPTALWWGIVTMTTTGYGDITPVTSIGRILGGLAMLGGIAMLAIPAGILASGFAEELRHREQINNWQIISNLELTRDLDSNCIADITRHLRSIVLPKNTVVFKKNSSPDAIYFIADGAVEVQIHPRPPSPIILKKGDVFGEAGLLENRKRNATIRTIRATRLMALDLHDFHRLANDHASLKKKIESINLSRKT
ncbi:MAG: ion transporter [Polynucleobacter sp.]|jgi:voltage-gated potassium channel|nr:ion transporter [Polynucleobacter sp.]